jgi:hypothetical protein
LRWETFAAINGGLRNQDNWKFVSAELQYPGSRDGMLRARANSRGPWEGFRTSRPCHEPVVGAGGRGGGRVGFPARVVLGCRLALRAAASGRIAGIQRVVAFEPPFVVGRGHHVPPAGLGQRLHELVAANRRSETVRFYMTKGMGIPRMFVALMRVLPVWSKLKATANSTPPTGR